MKSGRRYKRRSIAVPILSGTVAVMLAAIVMISFAYYRQMRLNQFTKNILFSDNYFLRNFTYNIEESEPSEGFTRSEASRILAILGIEGENAAALPDSAESDDVKALYYNCASSRFGITHKAFYRSEMNLDAESYTADELFTTVGSMLADSSDHTEYPHEEAEIPEYLDRDAEDPEYSDGEIEVPEERADSFVDMYHYHYGTVTNFSTLITEGMKNLSSESDFTADHVVSVYYYCIGELLHEEGGYLGVEIKRSAEIDAVISENTDGLVRILDVDHISQLPEYPNGCEPVSAVMLLKECGFDITKEEFIETYLIKEPVKISWGVRFGPNPEKAYAGDPASEKGGWGCFAPVIEESLNSYLAGSSYEAKNISGISLDKLCENYIDRGIPAAVWVTVDFSPVNEVYQWLSADRDEVYLYPKNQHCAVLIGYDKDNYYFCDPLKDEAITVIGKNDVSESWSSMGSQAVVIVEK